MAGKFRRLSLALLFLSVFANSVSGADIAISPSGSGNGTGSDWSNTMSWTAATFVRGNTYYLMDGVYKGKTLKTPNSGSTYIYIKKATGSAHGPSAGWQTAYGDGEALFNDSSVYFETDYWIFDGVLGKGKGTSEPYGIRFYSDRASDTSILFIRFLSDASHITVSHVEAHRPSKNHRARVVDATDQAIHGVNTNILIKNCYFHDIMGIFYHFYGDNHITIENCINARNKSTSERHAEAIQNRLVDYFTVKNSLWEDIQGTYGIGCANHNPGQTQPSLHWRIYGNTFYVTSSSASAGFHGHADIGTNHCSTGDWQIYNNTFIENDFRPSSYGGIKIDDVKAGYAGTNKAYNNFFWNERYVFMQNVEQKSNTYARSTFSSSVKTSGDGNVNLGEIASPFISLTIGKEDFRLSQATASGQPLNAPFNVDPYGIERGNDGVFDRGAYEYITGGEGVELAAPTNLRVTQ